VLRAGSDVPTKQYTTQSEDLTELVAGIEAHQSTRNINSKGEVFNRGGFLGSSF